MSKIKVGVGFREKVEEPGLRDLSKADYENIRSRLKERDSKWQSSDTSEALENYAEFEQVMQRVDRLSSNKRFNLKFEYKSNFKTGWI